MSAAPPPSHIPPISLSFSFSPVSLPIYQFAFFFFFKSIYLFSFNLCLPVSTPACLPACLPSCLSARLSDHMPACLSAYLFACLLVCPPAYLPACLSASIFSPLFPFSFHSARLLSCVPPGALPRGAVATRPVGLVSAAHQRDAFGRWHDGAFSRPGCQVKAMLVSAAAGRSELALATGSANTSHHSCICSALTPCIHHSALAHLSPL